MASFQLDQILDFNPAEDRIDVSGWGVGTMAALRQVMMLTGVGSGLQVRRNDVTTLVNITGVGLADLTDDRFILSAGASTTPIAGSLSNDHLFGGLGADSISGNGGFDLLFGEQGADTLLGGSLVDTLDGGEGNDSLVGSGGNDLLVGGTGNDTLSGGEGSDELRGGAGLDLFRLGLSAGAVPPDVVRDFSLAEDRIDLAPIGIASLGVARQIMAQDASGHALLRVLRDGSEAAMLLQGIGIADLLTTNFQFQARTAPATLAGGALADDLFGALGNDTLGGGGGADRLFGDLGADTLDGGAANDRLLGNEGADVLRGGLDADTLLGGGAGDLLLGQGGNDWLDGGIGADTLEGGDGGNTLLGGTGNDVFRIAGDVASGHRILDFRPGEDRLDVAALGIGSIATLQRLLVPSSSDATASVLLLELTGRLVSVLLQDIGAGGLGAADVILSTVAAGETLSTTGNTVLFGGLGNDRLTGQYSLFGEQGDDTLTGAVINASAFDGGDGADSIVHTGTTTFHRLFGGAGDDTLQDGTAASMLYGGIGNDVLVGGGGADTLGGGAGLDWASYADAGASVVALLWSGYGSVGDAQGDMLIGIENLLGSDYDDTLQGDAGANWLKAGFNFDSLSGGAGDDTIEGGERADTMRGGSGADVFRYVNYDDGPTGAFDTILDFVSGVDKIDLSVLDANIGTAQDDPFDFIGTDAFTAIWQLRRSGDLLVADINGDATVDFQIQLAPGAVFLATDLIA